MRRLLFLMLAGCAPGTIGGGFEGGGTDPDDPGTEQDLGAPGVAPDGGAASPDAMPPAADLGPDPDGSAGSPEIAWPAQGLIPGAFLTPPHVGIGGGTSVTVSFGTTVEAPATLRYRTGSGLERTVDTPAGTDHHAVLEDLHPGAGYRYEVEVGGAVHEGVFVTPGADVVRMAHFGEFHAPSNSAEAAAFADVLRGFRPHLLVESGDMVDSGDDPDHWTDYLRTSAPWLPNAVLLPAHSNHVGNGAGVDHMVELFDLPDNLVYYATRYGPVEVLTIRSEWFDGRDAQSAWIREQSELAHDGVDDPAFLIAAWHHPACSSNYASRADSREAMMEDLVEPLIEGGGVDLILVGHDKYYERSWIDGDIPHVMTNVGKISPGDPGNNHPRCTTVTTDLEHNSTLLIEATATTLHARAVRPDGTQIDEFEIAR